MAQRCQRAEAGDDHARAHFGLFTQGDERVLQGLARAGEVFGDDVRTGVGRRFTC